jgi:hypothetical protein
MFVEFVAGKNGDPVTFLRLSGDRRRRPSFPPKNSDVKIGEFWEVEYAGENPAKTVYFLKLVKRFDVTELIGRKATSSYLVAPDHSCWMNENYAIHPDEYKVGNPYKEKTWDMVDQVWRFRVDHERRELIPVERVFWTEEERKKDELFQKALKIVEILAHLAGREKFQFFTSQSIGGDGHVVVQHKWYSSYHVGELIEVEPFDLDQAQEFFNNHLEEWRGGVERAEYRQAHPKSDYSPHGEDHIFSWIGRDINR